MYFTLSSLGPYYPWYCISWAYLFVHVAYLFVHMVLHIFSPRGLSTWSCILDTSCWWFTRHMTGPCLVCSQDTSCVLSALETQQGLLFCPPYSITFLVRSPTHSHDEATGLTCCFIAFLAACQFVAKCCHNNFLDSFVEMHVYLWTSVLVMVLWGYQPTWHL